MMLILLFARDPGAVNAIAPLIKPLLKKGFTVKLFSKEMSFQHFQKLGFISEDIDKEVEDISEETVLNFVNRINPAIILTGVGSTDYTEKYLWKAAETLKIPSFAIFDQWLNYGIRFSKYSISDIDKYNKDRKHPYLPSAIFVMDEQAKKEMVNIGIPGEKIIITGHPHFTWLADYKKQFTKKQLKNSKELLQINEDVVILFASEPISKDYNIEYIGYSEKTIFVNLINSLQKIVENNHTRVNLIIKPHPRENENTFDDFIKEYTTDKVKIQKITDLSSVDLILISNIICGMSSMLLIEALILEKPVLSIQIGLNNAELFILCKKGIIESIQNEEKLDTSLNELIKNPGCITKRKFEYKKDTIGKIISIIEKYECRNLQ